MVFKWNLDKVVSLSEVLESISDEELAKITAGNVVTKVKIAANACAAFQEDPLVSDVRHTYEDCNESCVRLFSCSNSDDQFADYSVRKSNF